MMKMSIIVVVDESVITKKPIVGIILTHFHADHTNGISVFLEDCEDPDQVEVISHDSLSTTINVFPNFNHLQHQESGPI